MLRRSSLLLALAFGVNCFAAAPKNNFNVDNSKKSTIQKKDYFQIKGRVIYFKDVEQQQKQKPSKFGDWFNKSPVEGAEGASVNRVYETFGAPQEEVIVAVIDSGVDVNHEDLRDVIWTNEDEIPGNGIDDDNNGYIDDFMGWNFIGLKDGNGKFEKDNNGDWTFKSLRPDLQINETTFEVSRELRKILKKDDVLVKQIAGYLKKKVPLSSQEQKELSKLQEQRREMRPYRLKLQNAYDKIYGENVKPLEDMVARKEQLLKDPKIDPSAEAQLKAQIAYFTNYINLYKNYYLNIWSTEPLVAKRDLEYKADGVYGNNDIVGPDADHGTHVAGIIAAVRDNQLGINGIASNVKIMAVRAVPDGDERDLDVALAIRYAVDNGAKVINMSFGKAFAENKAVVREAYKYAKDKGVFLVHAAGNDGKELFKDNNFPTAYVNDKEGDNKQFINSITVGASTPDFRLNFVDRYGRTNFVTLPADFSNWSNDGVDIFAPGWKINSSTHVRADSSNPGKMTPMYAEYSGTSMAAPVVSGVLALLKGYYPEKSLKDIREAVMESSRKYGELMVAKPDDGVGKTNNINYYFYDLSKSDGVVDAYKAYLELESKKQRKSRIKAEKLKKKAAQDLLADNKPNEAKK